jgi:hypothetical protein
MGVNKSERLLLVSYPEFAVYVRQEVGYLVAGKLELSSDSLKTAFFKVENKSARLPLVESVLSRDASTGAAQGEIASGGGGRRFSVGGRSALLNLG